MSGYVTDTLGWLAGAFYVIVALSIVYLYFFRITPMVIGTIQEWNIFVVVRVTIVLASLAFLIGCVAVITGDWIFSQVLDTLPRTRMAREIDRVSGSLVRLSAPGPIYNAGTGVSLGSAAGVPGPQGPAVDNTTAPMPDEEEPVSFPLKENALELWMGHLQQQYNPTGRYSDNESVMSRRDIPQGVTCDVAAVSGPLNGWRFKSNEEWRLVCSMDGFQSSVALTINGTAARGLTGGGYYSMENPYPVYGEGTWPDRSLDKSNPTRPAPAATVSGGASQDGAVGSATPEAPTTAANVANTHEVQRGESLALIAQKYQISVNSLVDANVQKYPQLSRNPNVIVVGWELTIPAE